MLALVNVFPVGKGESLGRYVALAVREARKSGLDMQLTAMGTLLEGDWDEVMTVVKRMRDRVLSKSRRVYVTVTLDDRRGARHRLTGKVRRVEDLLAKSVRRS